MRLCTRDGDEELTLACFYGCIYLGKHQYINVNVFRCQTMNIHYAYTLPILLALIIIVTLIIEKKIN